MCAICTDCENEHARKLQLKIINAKSIVKWISDLGNGYIDTHTLSALKHITWIAGIITFRLINEHEFIVWNWSMNGMNEICVANVSKYEQRISRSRFVALSCFDGWTDLLWTFQMIILLTSTCVFIGCVSL